MKTYNRRTWLNRKSSPSTGSCVAFYGPSRFEGDEGKNMALFEVADCHSKVRLHRSYGDSLEEFIAKIRTLAREADKFADFLESNAT